jgi:hypothetical protein
MLDYESHRYSIGSEQKQWSKLYTFSEAYNVASEEGLSSETYRAIAVSMEDRWGRESPVMKQYRSFALSGADGDDNGSHRGANLGCNSKCRDEVICTIQSATVSGYEECLLARKKSWIRSGRSIFGIVGAAVFATFLIIFVIVRSRRRSKRNYYETTPSVTSENAHSDANDELDQEMI